MQSEARQLDPAYYWENLRVVIDTVLDTQRHVFGVDEHALLMRWLALPEAAQMLYARLLQRRGPNFRRASLDYAEIDGVDAAITSLDTAGFIEARPELTLDERVGLFTMRELRRAAPSTPPRKLKREALIEWLIDHDARALSKRLKRVDRIIRRRSASLFSRAQVLFFGNRQQDLSTFVRVAIDQVRYPDYPIDRSHPLFASREDFDAYLEAGARWDEAFAARLAKDDQRLVELGEQAALDLVVRAPRAAWRERVDPARADSRVIYRAARAWERMGQATEAARLYGLLVDERRHAATAARAADRLGLLMHRAHDTRGFMERVDPLLEGGLLSGPGRRLVYRRLALMRLAPDPRHDDPPIPIRTFTCRHVGRAGSKALYALPNGTPGTVEEAVLAQLGGDGVWCEGAFYALVFALLCWDIIFAPLPGAFQHGFQDAPFDFGTARFYRRREGQFQTRFELLRSADRAAMVADAWQQHHGVACRGVQWDRFELDFVQRAVRDLGPGLVSVLRRYARHPSRHRAGLPDLLVWPKGEEGPLHIEVKGPGDQVSVEQSLWHTWLRQHGLRICVARVVRG